MPFKLPPAQKIFYDKQKVEYGELSRQGVYRSCWAFVHELSIDEELISDDPLVQALSVIDSRLGKRRLLKINKEALHPLALKLYLLIGEAEGLNVKMRTSI